MDCWLSWAGRVDIGSSTIVWIGAGVVCAGCSGQKKFQCFDGGKLFISYRLQWSVQVAVLECSSQIKDGAGYFVLVVVVWD